MAHSPLMHLHGEGCVAVKYGTEEAIFLDSIMFWYRTNRSENINFHEGRWWTYNAMKTYTELYPWWSMAQIRRIIDRCKAKGALLVGDFNPDRRDRTSWYSPSDELLALYGEPPLSDSICENQQMQMTDSAHAGAETSKALPCNTHDNTDIFSPIVPPAGDGGQAKPDKSAPKYRPDWFERFWHIYPLIEGQRKGRQEAARAWDKVKPDFDTARTMAAALERQKLSPQWRRENGRFIPRASTWLRNGRWKDEIVVPTGPPPDAGGWAPDPEVTS